MLPQAFDDWFAARGWRPRPHQLALVEHAVRGQSVLLVAPTGLLPLRFRNVSG